MSPQRTTNGWVSKYTGIHSDETTSNWFAVGDLALDKFMNFKTGCCAEHVPYVYDNNENFLGTLAGRLGKLHSATRRINTAIGNFQPSPDFSHMAFASQYEL